MSEARKIENIMGMVPSELIKWCKERKKSLGYSNQKLADLSGVPVGTIDRILSGSYQEFRYSSIQPIVAVLLGTTESTPDPEMTEGQYYYDTIEGYRMVVSEKNREIELITSRYEAAVREIEFLRTVISTKQSNIECLQRNCDWMQKVIDELHSKIK